MSNRVLITEPIVEDSMDVLKKHYEVTVGERGYYDDEQHLIEDIPEYDALLSVLSNPVSKQVIKAGKKLQIIANQAVGYDNVDVEAAAEAGIKVSNTPGVLTEASADGAFALLMSTARKICAAQAYLREGKFDGWDPVGFMGMELNGNTLGILGMGRIGQAVARRARGFGMNIIYHNRSKVDPDFESELGATYIDTVEELARKSDILSLNCPLTDETRHIINQEMLEMMPDHALLINTARGLVVDEEALAQALHDHQIGGAGLDVFEEEPNVHPHLLTAPNCVLTPHIASSTYKTRKEMGILAVNSIIGILEGKEKSEIPNLIETS